MRDATRDLAGQALAALLGVAAFFVFAGWPVLNPLSISWLAENDRAMHYLGWVFFRHSPWGLPPGLSPDFGVELSSSIALADGLPLFALPLKLISPLLPEPFQYWGIWMLLCFTLQGLLGYKIARELALDRALALLVAAFVIITPAFIFRLPLHMALAGHWTLLAAVYFYLRRNPPTIWAWPLLAALTGAVHAYLLAMVLAVWVAALLRRFWLGQLTPARVLIEAALLVGLTFTVLWAAGFFVISSFGAWGFGEFRLNLLGPIIPYIYSVLWPDIAANRHDYEGLSFLGVGIVALGLLALLSGAFVRLRSLLTPRWLPLFIVAVLLWLFALSDHIALSTHMLIEIPLPKWSQTLTAMFRSSGRFVWPALYLATIAVIVLLARRFSAKTVFILAALAFNLQLLDSSDGWHDFAKSLPPASSQWQTPLTSPFWQRAADSGIKRIRAIPVLEHNRRWQPLAYFAAQHHLSIDAIYIGRVDAALLAKAQAKAAEILKTGAFEPQTLYVLSAAAARSVAELVQPGDLFATIDYHIVLVRGGAQLVEGLGIDPLAYLTVDLAGAPCSMRPIACR